MSQHKKNIFVKCKILLKNILSFLDKIFKIYVETTHCKCGVFLPKWDNKCTTIYQNVLDRGIGAVSVPLSGVDEGLSFDY
ncbi:hypothetical protein [Candidatus Tisiphia endosymbiont of Parasteatoda lunata]|uniref:hypothetical protein n=1 Tax=Candidatus Tisiphia endosymbiont of Parasteatoda lunata TaxID=3066275 RepID=UPI00313E40C5